VHLTGRDRVAGVSSQQLTSWPTGSIGQSQTGQSVSGRSGRRSPSAHLLYSKGEGILAAVGHQRRLPVNATLIKRVQASVNALDITPADEALVGLALLLARTVDGMDDETPARMLGQTAGQLVGVLAALRKQAAPKPWSKWDEMRPGVVASRRLGAGTY
jgi:hypothetical protein